MNDHTEIFNDPGYNVYLLYQKEVYNCDHSFLQSMMDWLYTSNDSPYKFRFRNKAFININHFGISIQKDNTLSPQSQSNESNHTLNQIDSFNWPVINFNLKHLKEIYVDKRHKDTCVLVSKVPSSQASHGQNGVNKNPNYVWKMANPSNYQSFRSPYSLNSAYKKSYLLTIVKFKDGPGRLLQSIQLLDNILADYNKKDFSTVNNLRNNNQTSNHKNNDASKENGKNEKISKSKLNGQQNMNEFYSKNLQQQQQNQQYQQLQLQKAQHLNGSSNYLNLNYQNTTNSNIIYNHNQNLNGHNSLKSNYNNSNMNRAQQRRLSVDNKQNIYNSLNPAYNNSNVSLENYLNNMNNRNAITPTANQLSSLISGTISRQSSSNDIRPPVPPTIMNRPFTPGSVHSNLNNSSLNHFYQDPTNNNNMSTSSVPASPAPIHYLINNIKQYPKMQASMNSRSSSKSSQIIPNYINNVKTEINTSNENLSEIGYQQYKKKLSRARNIPISSTSSLQNTDIFPGVPFIPGNPNYGSLKRPNKSPNMYFPDIRKQKDQVNQIYNSNFGFIPINNPNSGTNSVYSSNQRINQYNQSQFHPQFNQNYLQKAKPQDIEQNKHNKAEKKNSSPTQKSEDDYDDDSNSQDQDESSSNPDNRTDDNEYTDEDQLKTINTYSANNRKTASIDKSKEDIKSIRTAKCKNNNENSTENESDDGDDGDDDNSDEDVEDCTSLKTNNQQIRIDGIKIKSFPSTSASLSKSPHLVRKSILDLNAQQKEQQHQQDASNKIAQKILLDYIKNKIDSKQKHISNINHSKQIENNKISPTPIDEPKSQNKTKLTANLNVLPSFENINKNRNDKTAQQVQKIGQSNYFQAKNINDEITNQTSKIYFSNQNLNNSNEILVSSIHEQTTSQIQDEIKFEHNKVKEIIKSFNNYEKNFLYKNQTVNINHLNQVINSTVINSLSNNFEKSFNSQDQQQKKQHHLITNKDKTVSSTSLSKQELLLPQINQDSSKTTTTTMNKFILNNANKIKNSNFIQNSKENNHNHYFSNLNSESKSINIKDNDSLIDTKPIQQQQDNVPQANTKVNSLVYTFDSKMNQHKEQIQAPINESSLSEYTSLKLQLNDSFSSSANNFSNYEVKQYGYKSNYKKKYNSNDRKPISVVSPSSTSSSSNNSSPKQSLTNMNNHYGSNMNINIKNNDAKNVIINNSSPNAKAKSNVQILKSNFSGLNENSKTSIVINNSNSNAKSKITTNQLAVKFNNLINAELEKSALNHILPSHLKPKNIAKNNNNNNKNSSNETNPILINTQSPKNKQNIVQNLTIDKTIKPQNLKDYDVPVIKIEKLGTSVTEPQKNFFPEKIEHKVPIIQANSKTQSNTTVSTPTPATPPSTPVQLAQVQPYPAQQQQQTVQRKRTFANMIWPMDPEEEKILRSSSPYVVPEIIVQRNERVKSILKKNNCLSPSANSTNTSNLYSPPSSNISNTTSTNNSPFGKKRVDFHENFLFFNFFETNNDDDHNQSGNNLNATASNVTAGIPTTVNS